MSKNDVYIIGAGIHPFGRHDISGLDQGVFAVREAIMDAELEWPEMRFAFGGSSAAGAADAMLPRLGLTGTQFINIANGCATGGSALLSGYWAIKSGEFDVGIVTGFDKHPRGAFNADPEENGLPMWYGETGMMMTTQFFAMKIRRYMDQFGISEESLGRVSEKAFENGARTPHAWRRQPVDFETIMSSQMLSDPLRKFMFCSPAEGGAALILASEKKASELGRTQCRIHGAAVRTRPEGSFEVFSPSLSIERGQSPSELASAAAFDMAGLGPEDGRLPVNTDGGCLACGEPIGASGLRQVYENVMQVRGTAGERQVDDTQIAYSQVYGAPGLSAVCIIGA